MPIEDPDNVALPGELDADEELPFRRRQRAVPVRRSRLGRLRRVLRWLLMGILLLPPLGYAGYRLLAYSLTSPRFMLTSPEDVVLSGNRYVSCDEVMNALGLPAGGRLARGGNIFRLSLEEKRRQVESIPWVQCATLTRAYPNHLAVYLVERTPVAFVNVEGRVKLIDGEGVLLERPERASFDFPVLTGLDAAGSREERAARLALFEEFSREIANESAGSGWVVSEVNLADPDDLKAILVQARATLQVHFGHSEFRERFHDFLTLLPEVRKANSRIDSIDLRYRNQVVVNPQATTDDANASRSLPAGSPAGD